MISDYQAAHAIERVDLPDGREAVQEVVRRIKRYGFAIARVGASIESESEQALVAQLFDLGDPYVPRIYSEYAPQFAAEYVHIRSTTAASHPSFSSGNAQPFHVDGLLEPIGTIKASLLYCIQPAAQGGCTILFNSCHVFAELLQVSPDAAAVLLRPHILGRRSTLDGIDAEAIGPAFSYTKDGELIGRYCDGGDTEYWYPAQEEREPLEWARSFFAESSRVEGPNRRAIALQAGECLLMRNDWISHAREPFTDDPRNPRHLVRALYLQAFDHGRG
jgi:hypothetical protein